MSSKKIEQLIDDIYEYIEGCKPKSFSTTQVIVMKDEIYDLLDQMRLRIPDEIKRCAKVVANRDQIIANAEERAEKIIADAKLQAEALVQESEIMRQAYLQANEMVSRATQDANTIIQTVNYDAEQMKAGALAYTNDMLGEIERVLSYTYTETKSKVEGMLNALEQNLEIVKENRRELNEDITPEQKEAPALDDLDADEEYGTADDDFDLDEDALYDNID